MLTPDPMALRPMPRVDPARLAERISQLPPASVEALAETFAALIVPLWPSAQAVLTALAAGLPLAGPAIEDIEALELHGLIVLHEDGWPARYGLTVAGVARAG